MSLRHSREIIACLQRISALSARIKALMQARPDDPTLPGLRAQSRQAVARLDALRRDLPIQDEKGRLKGRRVNNQRKTS